MGIAPDAVASYVDRAVEAMADIVGDLGDDLANARPGLPGANSPYAILRHCLGVMEFWGGQVVAGRTVDRDREASRELVIGSVLTELLGILDDVGRAREAGELEGAFKAVAESLERVTEKLGLVKYGEQGDPFDPRIHEALLHNYSDEVDGPTATLVMQPGYRLGERVLRPARVAVSEPTEQLPAEAVQADVPVENTDEDQAADKPAE